MKRVYRFLMVPASFVMMMFLCFLMKTTAEAKSFTLEDNTVVEATELPVSGSTENLTQPYYYMQNGDVYYNYVSRYDVQNDVTIILPDGYSASTNIKFYIYPGKSLTICGELTGAGTFSCAGIYGANGEASYTFTLNSGTVTVSGSGSGNDSGIGAYDNQGCSDCSIVINGGSLTVGAHSGVALGSSDFGNITINGGVVNATAAATDGIGICAAKLTINGGQVTATGDAAGIKAVNDYCLLAMTDYENDWVKATATATTGKAYVGYIYIDKNHQYVLSDGTEITYHNINGGYYNGEKIQPMRPGFKSMSVSLDGKIGLNVYVYLPGDLDNLIGTKVDFTINKGNLYERHVSTEIDFNNYDYDGFYKFTVYVQSVEMGDDIEATCTPAAASGISAFSLTTPLHVSDYCKDLYDLYFPNTDLPKSSEYKNLAKALFNYGVYAQEFLSQNSLETWTIDPESGVKGHKGMGSRTTKGSFTIPDIDKDNPGIDGIAHYFDLLDSAGITNITYSVVMDSETAIKIFITTGTGVTLDSAIKGDQYYGADPVITKTGENSYVVAIRNIPAANLKSLSTLTLKTSAGEATASVSPISYATALLNSSYGGKNEVKYAMKALDDYYKAALALNNN